ncbi:hypothetical protein BC936DRAFT_143416 [Jimgerdemannia flammicorona]|uniref:Uncharacterized protein n=1 Tax=Jimgerdemannia flammicorona TaxID=994334 RepID=A0A433DDZ4_9FUNG|nr:hypothetical protein BC936DRAFT_143416 [Jimgerdemannia flammicorona]
MPSCGTIRCSHVGNCVLPLLNLCVTYTPGSCRLVACGLRARSAAYWVLEGSTAPSRLEWLSVSRNGDNGWKAERLVCAKLSWYVIVEEHVIPIWCTSGGETRLLCGGKNHLATRQTVESVFHNADVLSDSATKNMGSRGMNRLEYHLVMPITNGRYRMPRYFLRRRSNPAVRQSNHNAVLDLGIMW